MKSAHWLLDKADASLPTLNYAVALQQVAATVDFDWSDIRGIIAKIHEETDEIVAELHDADPQRLTDEVGDLLFAVTNLARHLQVDPHIALQHTNRKFYQRFQFIEHNLRQQGKTLSASSLAEMDALWEAAKTANLKS